MPRLPRLAFAAAILFLVPTDPSRAQLCLPLPTEVSPDFAQPDDEMGSDIAAFEEFAVVGRAGSDGAKGSALVVELVGGTWQANTLLTPGNVSPGSAFGFSVAIFGPWIVVGAPFENASGTQSGAAYVFRRAGAGWVLDHKIAGDDAFSLFGFDVAVWGNRIAIADLSSFDESVRVFENVGGVWTSEVRLLAPIGMLLGQSLAMSDEFVAAGAPLDDFGGADSGAVYVYDRNGGSWDIGYRVVPTTQLAGERFGSSVALEGDRLVAGAPRGDDPTPDAGRACVFSFDGASWTEEVTLEALDHWVQFQSGSGDLFGWSVAIDGDAIAVGSPGRDDRGTDSGAVYLYTLNEGEWIFQSRYVAPGSSFDFEFGYSVAISGTEALAGMPARTAGAAAGGAFVMPCFDRSAKFPRASTLDGGAFGLAVSAWGDRVLVGAPRSGPDGSENIGSASVWASRGTAWEMEADLVPADSAPFTLYGFKLALSGDVAAVGSPGGRTNGVLTGAVYVFARDGGGTWSEEAKVVPAGVASGDAYSQPVALDGETLVVGAFLDDDFGTNSGSVYVFTRSGGAWTLEQQLFPDVIEPYAHFGAAVAVSGDTIVVGAPHDESGQVGTGSAYVFTRSGGAWTLEAKVAHSTPFVGDRFGSSVAASGDTFAVVAPGQGGILETYLYSRAGGWPVEAILGENVALPGTAVRGEVSLVGDLLALSMNNEIANPSVGRGMVVLYVRSQGAWSRRQVLSSNDNNQSESFGIAVSIAGGSSPILAVGDHVKFGRVNNDGAVYAYRLDRTPPVIQCPEDIFIRADNGGEVLVHYSAEATDDTDAEPTIECSPPSGSAFPTGSSIVTCRATDDLNNESTCQFGVHVQPAEIFFRRGNVDGAGNGPVDVLFVNDSPGDPVERTLDLTAADPLVMRVETPPSSEGEPRRLAMYVWLREPTAATVRELPFGIGHTCLPTPLNPGGPQPRRIANSLGYPALLGVENWPGPPTGPAPATLLALPAVGRALTLFAQGIIVDSSSPNDVVAVTNGVLVRVTD